MNFRKFFLLKRNFKESNYQDRLNLIKFESESVENNIESLLSI